MTAVGGFNSVTLTWDKASDPVSYYLVTYGTSVGSQTYGNPNVGGSSTTSYTVTNLSGGVTYYFRVRAGNGCMPGDYSNELAATPTGGPAEGPAVGFEEGILGLETPSALEATPEAEQVNLGDILGKESTNWLWWFILLLFALGAGNFWWYWQHRNN